MEQPCFYILKGNNGTTYIFNLKNWSSIKTSLEFYRADTFRSRFKKKLLSFYLLFISYIKLKDIKQANEVDAFINKKIGSSIDFEIDTNCSILIAQTNNKVVVNHHFKYFQKFAFGESYENVLNESKVYELFTHPKTFKVSKLFDLVNDPNIGYCSFKLESSIKNKKNNDDVLIVKSMLEFFKTNQKQSIQFSQYIDSLLKLLEPLNLKNRSTIEDYSSKIKLQYGHYDLPLGLVHRDFKPWNTVYNKKLLIFDFEETILNGPPLEDVFNFYIDPKIRYETPESVHSFINSNKNTDGCNKYLDDLKINISFEALLFTYTLERIIFWSNANVSITANAYIGFLNYLVKN